MSDELNQPKFYKVRSGQAWRHLNLRQFGELVNLALPVDGYGCSSLRPNGKSIQVAAIKLGISQSLAKRALSEYNWN
jgi:hypothetical protein